MKLVIDRSWGKVFTEGAVGIYCKLQPLGRKKGTTPRMSLANLRQTIGLGLSDSNLLGVTNI